MIDWGEVVSSAELDNVLDVTEKLGFIQRLDLPHDLVKATGKRWVDQIVRRVAGEKASEMRRHAQARQLGLYAIYLMSREAQLTDAMIDLLIETVHKIGTRTKRKGEGEIAKDRERETGRAWGRESEGEEEERRGGGEKLKKKNRRDESK